MKLLDRIVILLLNLCLLFSAILIPALSFAQSPDYFHRAFARTGLYARQGEDGVSYRSVIRYIGGDSSTYALLSDRQLDVIAGHITAYMRGERDHFELYMDNVYLNDGYADGVRIFGDEAIAHMKDVRSLVLAAKIAAAILCGLLPFLFLYLIIRRRSAGRIILRYTLYFYAALLTFAILFVLWSALLDGGDYGLMRALWRNIHHLLFPFQPEKVAGSFFNDALTYILRVELFMGAVYTIVGILAATLSCFLLFALLLRRAAGQAAA